MTCIHPSVRTHRQTGTRAQELQPTPVSTRMTKRVVRVRADFSTSYANKRPRSRQLTAELMQTERGPLPGQTCVIKVS